MWYMCIYHEYFMLLIWGSFSKLHQSFISSKHASHKMQINRCKVKLLPLDFIEIRAHVDPILVKPTIDGFIKPKDLGKILFIIIYYMTCNETPTKYHKKKKEKRKEGMHLNKWNTHRNLSLLIHLFVRLTRQFYVLIHRQNWPVLWLDVLTC